MMARTIEEVLKEMQGRVTVQPSSETTAAINYNCDKCKDQGGIIEWREADVFGNGQYIRKEEVWVECSCVKQKKINKLLKTSEITDEFQKMTFGNFHTEGYQEVIKKMYDTAFQYCQAFNSIKNTRCNSIALIGQPGAGKTHLLSAIANGMITKLLVPVLYFPYIEGTEDLRSDFDQLANKIQRLKEVDVLFIDDLFKPVTKVVNGLRIKEPRATAWQVEKMFEVINYRYLNNKPLLISSELSFDDMLDIDEALCTRIFEMCSDYTVTIKQDIKLNHRLLKMREAK
ncbi:DnaA ATPase domain-containing protein [Rummeliibacillus sp. BSL5]